MPLDPAFAEILLRWRALCPSGEQGWVFPNPNTGMVWHSSVLQGEILVPAGKKIGIENLGWHTFRQSYRSMLDVWGAPIGVQQKLMRHAQVSTTMQYGNCLYDGEEEGARSSCADGTTRKYHRKCGDFKRLCLAWGLCGFFGAKMCNPNSIVSYLD